MITNAYRVTTDYDDIVIPDLSVAKLTLADAIRNADMPATERSKALDALRRAKDRFFRELPEGLVLSLAPVRIIDRLPDPDPDRLSLMAIGEAVYNNPEWADGFPWKVLPWDGDLSPDLVGFIA